MSVFLKFTGGGVEDGIEVMGKVGVFLVGDGSWWLGKWVHPWKEMDGVVLYVG